MLMQMTLEGTAQIIVSDENLDELYNQIITLNNEFNFYLAACKRLVTTYDTLIDEGFEHIDDLLKELEIRINAHVDFLELRDAELAAMEADYEDMEVALWEMEF